jgi:hypothetical protein
MMNIFYNSPHYVIVAYPLQQGLELVDKIDSRSLFVLGPLARELRKAIVEVPADDRSQSRSMPCSTSIARVPRARSFGTEIARI